MAIKKIKLIEGVSDMFDKNLDPAVLRDRMNQAARARDLALEAATVAENAGNTSLAAQLRKDAEDLQQILELTRQSANIHSDDEIESSVHDQAQNEAETDIPSSDSEEDDLSDGAEDAPDEEPSADDEEEEEEEEDASDTSEEASTEEDSSENEDAADVEDEAEEDTDSKDLTEPASEEEEENDHSPSAEDEEDAEEESGSSNQDASESGSDDIDSEDSSSSDSSDQDASATNDVSSSDSSSDDNEEANGDDENEYDESDAYGPPKVKDDLVLQDPFKNDQIDMPMPKNISDALKSGSLKLEPEIDAIIRILSTLKGEARRGAEQALKDYFEALDPLGDIYEENS